MPPLATLCHSPLDAASAARRRSGTATGPRPASPRASRSPGSWPRRATRRRSPRAAADRGQRAARQRGRRHHEQVRAVAERRAGGGHAGRRCTWASQPATGRRMLARTAELAKRRCGGYAGRALVAETPGQRAARLAAGRAGGTGPEAARAPGTPEDGPIASRGIAARKRSETGAEDAGPVAHSTSLGGTSYSRVPSGHRPTRPESTGQRLYDPKDRTNSAERGR